MRKDITLEPGKRYVGSGIVNDKGDFFFRPYQTKKNGLEGKERETEKVAFEDANSIIYVYKDKYTIKIDVPKNVTINGLFLQVTNLTKRLKDFLF